MATAERITTAEELLHAPGLGRCELVRGELVMMSPAGAEHGYIVMNVGVPLGAFVKGRNLGRVYGAETGFWISRDPDSVRAPDVAFVSAQRVATQPAKGFFEGAPDLAVEVLSPDDRPAEVATKLKDWLTAGCRQVWVVDPRARSITVYRHDGTNAVLRIGEQLTGEELVPGFTLPVDEIFA